MSEEMTLNDVRPMKQQVVFTKKSIQDRKRQLDSFLESYLNTNVDQACDAILEIIARLQGSERDKEVLTEVFNRIRKGNSIIAACSVAMPYHLYLQTEHWKNVRSAALERCENKCSLCNSSDELHCHHRSYARLGMESASDVICLCKRCHSVFHENGLVAEGQYVGSTTT